MDSSSESGKAQAGGESHLPYWKAGSGHYGDTLGPMHSQLVSASVDLVLSFIDSIPINKNGVFTIGDYGTNDGYASMPLMCSVIEHLRKKHGDGLTIQVIYEDQEKNDFNSLFNRLSDSSSYLTKFKDVYPLATNINFYKQCVPDGTCDIVFTSIATHWMEKLEVSFRDCVFHIFGTKEEQRIFHVEAELDWTKFLVLRAKELKPGGLLVAVNICRSEEKDIVTIVETVINLEQVWKQLKEDTMITQEEYERCTFKMSVRNAQEIQSPFQREGSAVRQSGLRLVHYDEVVNPCVYKAHWREHQRKTAATEENRAVFADRLVTAHRVWCQTTFHSSLSEGRTESEKGAILDELFSRVHALVMSTPPEDFRSDEYVSRLIARKIY